MRFMNESLLSHDRIYKSTFGPRRSGHQPKVLRKNWKKIREKLKKPRLTSWCSRITTFSVLSVHKNMYTTFVYTFVFFKERNGMERRVDGGVEKHNKKSFSPFSIYSEPPCMYWEILYVIRSVRKKKIIVGEKIRKESYHTNTKPERKKEEGKNHLRCEEKCNEEISRFFPSSNSFATSCVEG